MNIFKTLVATILMTTVLGTVPAHAVESSTVTVVQHQTRQVDTSAGCLVQRRHRKIQKSPLVVGPWSRWHGIAGYSVSCADLDLNN